MVDPTRAQTTWLVRISTHFAGLEREILDAVGAKPLKKLGRDVHLVRLAEPSALRTSEAAIFVRWNLPVHHSWPCVPKDTDGFVEKAAQAMMRKFGGAGPQTVIIGPLDPSDPDRYHKTLASNLRGRTLQLFPKAASQIRDAENQDPQAPTLFALVGREGLFCGLQSPREANGFHAGGTKFIRQNSPDTVSRAGAKIAEALHYLKLHRPLPPAGSRWLELGASPGGMTSELLARGYQVTAVDRAPLDARLTGKPGLRFIAADASDFQAQGEAPFDAILSDMNGDPLDSMARVVRLSKHLIPGGIVIFTLKLPGAGDLTAMLKSASEVREMASRSGLRIVSTTHLTYNRHELTMFLELPPLRGKAV